MILKLVQNGNEICKINSNEIARKNMNNGFEVVRFEVPFELYVETDQCNTYFQFEDMVTQLSVTQVNLYAGERRKEVIGVVKINE